MKTDEERYMDAAADLAETFCPSCKEYKGKTECEDCGVSYCIFCDGDECPEGCE